MTDAVVVTNTETPVWVVVEIVPDMEPVGMTVHGVYLNEAAAIDERQDIISELDAECHENDAVSIRNEELVFVETSTLTR